MDPEADIIVVFGGTNDYGHGDAPFGEIGDKERTTFCGAVDYLINRIRELYPSALLVMVTQKEYFMKTFAKIAKETACWLVFFVTGHGPVAIRAIGDGILNYSGQGQ